MIVPASAPVDRGDAAPGRRSVVEDGTWHTIDHESAVGGARRGASAVAARLGFGTDRAAEVGLVVSELATNQLRHAGSGSVLVRVRRTGADAVLDVLAVDSGPGMRDIEAAMRDGVSSRGTLGIGLGTVSRLSSGWDAWTAPGRGTVVAAAFAPPRTPVHLDDATGVTRPMTGQGVCGDAFAVRHDEHGPSLLVADGLGHGPLAAVASDAAVRAFLDAPAGPPVAVLQRVHAALGGTRGAAVAVARVVGDVLEYAGLGNISGSVTGTRARGLVSHPGIAGSHGRSLRGTTYAVEPGDVVVMHSDGLTDRWSLADYPGLARRSPLVVSGVLLRDQGVRRDDSCVAVLRAPRAEEVG
ncbi:ATP-binding SpoIIE family protein phosphatase [Cellulosimicrobium marinum]|uniref:ATP-binding SpoIIE family protein phosphatase n=1 Tax=Cellulosimicrobium marinum TaxID=1638992 RepID=UPI001E2E55FE|nr:ATP-binding SpoIIE family protein phosphatase [Cellulosimicrobium marinum]MCB7136125.1 ATP-binding protein/SpoIIE family protein phosphatase [Cellulosimicrobium marinum]